MIGTRRPPDQALVSKDDVGDQDRGDLPGLAQPSGTPALRMSSMIRSRRFK
jgi:hypothetical protein